MTTLNVTPPTAAPTSFDPPAGGASDWAAIHAEVQSVLRSLDGPVCQEIPQTRVREHPSTTGGAMLFMSYREFSRSDLTDTESILSSVECWKLPDGTWKVRGDLCGEESGRLHYDAPDVVVAAKDMSAVQRAAVDLAYDLVAHTAELVTALEALGAAKSEGTSQ